MGYRGFSSGSHSSFFSHSDDDHIEFVDVSSLENLEWPFGRIDSLDNNDLREMAYELFFMACRSSPGFGGRNPLTYYPSGDNGGGEVLSGRSNGQQTGGVMGTSRIKKALGLKAKKSLLKKTAVLTAQPSILSTSGSPRPIVRRPLTSAEIMRQQMKVTEQSDYRLRKTLMRSFVGQIGRRAETIILPLELLRHLKPSEFTDNNEYHLWQKRQLRILEAGLILHPSIPLEQSNSSGKSLREIIRSAELRPIDTSKNSDVMRSLCNCVMELAWRGDTDTCHWIDGFPINIHLYVTLLRSIFDLREETVVLDEVDELLELMKKTWSILGITRAIHNVCFSWVLFQQFVTTGQTEQELLCAALLMMPEIANDWKREESDQTYGKISSAVLMSMQEWAERRLLDHHAFFGRGGGGDLEFMENLLALSLTVGKIIEGNTSPEIDATGNRVDFYIRSSLRNAFHKNLEESQQNRMDGSPIPDPLEAAESLQKLARLTEELALKEKEYFTPILKKYLPTPAGIAVVTLHTCYGVSLRQYVTGRMRLTPESLQVLQTAGKLEKLLVQMAVDDSADCDDGGKSVIREMTPYEVDSIVAKLMRTWIEERLEIGRSCLTRARDIETWSQRSKAEIHARSAVELMAIIKEAIEDFFEIPVTVEEDLVQELADGLETLIQDYSSFVVSSCGSKRSYMPRLPALTRCNQATGFGHLWRRVNHCRAGTELGTTENAVTVDQDQVPPSTSKGTQRLYVRLNTLHYLYHNLHYLDRSLYVHHRRRTTTSPVTPTPSPSPNPRHSHRFNLARTAIQSAVQHVSEVAAFRLIFLDSNSFFYDGLYFHGVAMARIGASLPVLKRNLEVLFNLLTERVQPLVVKEVMKATFEAFLMVLLAGGKYRAFSQLDHPMLVEDFRDLKRIFESFGVEDEFVKREAEVVEGILVLMALPTEQLIEDFCTVASEASTSGIDGTSDDGWEKILIQMPPTTGRWNRTDPNTMLRVLCYRNDESSDRFLKKTFRLPRRRR